MWYLPQTKAFSIMQLWGLWVLTSSWVSSWRGRNAASRIAVWSVLSFCHSLTRRISKWVALLRPAEDCNSLSWFSSTASARAITWREGTLGLGMISQSPSPQPGTFGTLLFSFQTTRWTLSSTDPVRLNNEEVIIHPLASFFEKTSQSNSKSIWPGWE